VVWTGRFKKFFKMVLRLPHLVHEIMFSSHDILRIGVVGFLIIAVIAGQDGNALRMLLLPFLLPLVPFLAPLTVALDGVAWPPLAAAFTLTRMKVAATTSSQEVCRVAPW
jgi:hypothetical protein